MPDEQYLLIVTDDGHGKRVPVSDIPKLRRNRLGVRISSEPVAAALRVSRGQHLVIFSAQGKVERIAADDVPIRRRRVYSGGVLATGVRVMTLASGDRVAAVGLAASDIPPNDLETIATGSPPSE